jgi:hypothetical protein
MAASEQMKALVQPLTTFSTAAGKLADALVGFGPRADKLADALNGFPREFHYTHAVNTTSEVIANGNAVEVAEGAVKDMVQRMAEKVAIDAVQREVNDRLADAPQGRPRSMY